MKKMEYKPNMKKTIGMIAGGSGITPMIQVLREILKSADDKTEVSLLFANRTEQDIILKQQLDDAACKYANFKVTYVLSQPTNPSAWTGETGHINSDLVQKYIPTASPDTFVFVCGPPPFMKSISGDKDFSSTPPKQGEVSGILKELGYTGIVVVVIVIIY